MLKRIIVMTCFSIGMFMSAYCGNFIETEADWLPLMGRQDVIVIASPGRSGSSLLSSRLKFHARRYQVVKTHLMVPKGFKGRVIFIFSNPDLAAESALHQTLVRNEWGDRHFSHMFSSDKEWLAQLGGDTQQQTMEHNFLSYDALGTGVHLQEWLLNSGGPASANEANVLAIKYENLWDVATQSAIKEFLSMDIFRLPQQRQRGYLEGVLNGNELAFRQGYNKGTYENPRYDAYDFAREIWKDAPPFQYLKR